MPIEIRMPALSPTMTEGNLARWLKKEGDAVHSGDVIAEIETDKATMEYEAADEGRLGRIIVPEGAQGIKVNAPIALLLEEGEDAAALDKFAPAAAPAAGPNPNPPLPGLDPGTAGKGMPGANNPPPQSPGQARGGEGRVGDVGNGARPANGEGRIFASPLARRMAVHAGIDLATLRGSGPQGRIVKADIDAVLAHPGAAAPAPQRAPAAAIAPGAAVFAKPQVLALAGTPPFTEKPLTAMRRVIARRLTESKQTVPHHYMSVDCAIDDLLKIRATLNAKSDSKISINDFVIRAAALALRQVPAANASWSDDEILLWQRADISVAVALDDGLITPIVKGADQKGLAQIAAEMKDLAARARAGKLKLDEFQGGTFSISNLGMYGIRDFAAVINPPQGCILAVGAGEQRPVVRGGQLAVATVMTCTLSCDHRVVDGAVGAQFLAAFKKLIEDPLTMLL
ncbi:MAG TPA: pyruvate dehydrogenase complex dihydrolipoamide acetyltransferase [Stellaceae bacterium]|nr:pyruvate dehydrogenase complex dihydrolipoamide acetyltransferase [Stellaceae bacterium]